MSCVICTRHRKPLRLNRKSAVPLLRGGTQPMHMVPMVAFKRVRVYVKRDRNTTMTECLLDRLWVRSLLDQKPRKRVPEIVKPYPPKLCQKIWGNSA